MNPEQLILEAIHKAYAYAKSKERWEYLAGKLTDVANVPPYELPKFMDDNNIPKNAQFFYVPGKSLYLFWEVLTKATPEQVEAQLAADFKLWCGEFAYKALFVAGLNPNPSYGPIPEGDLLTLYQQGEFTALVTHYKNLLLCQKKQ